MIKQTYTDIVTPELIEGAIENNEFEGFKADYHVLHALLKKCENDIASVCEIGTNLGRGTKIIKHDVPNATVYSLDLPTELAHISLQHPINEGHGDKVGSLCDLPFVQLRGDSAHFDFSAYPCDAYFVDGEHTYGAVRKETEKIAELAPVIIIYHDANIDEVYNAIVDGFQDNPHYDLFRVTDTRIAYALRK